MAQESCDEEEEDVSLARRAFSRVDERVLMDKLALGGGAVTVVASTAAVGLAEEVNPLAIAVWAGSILGELLLAEKLKADEEELVDAKKKYQRAKGKYEACMLAALPPDTG
jgi:hypothetical protein